MTGVNPHQQVNQICRRLETDGLIERRRDATGQIVNLPLGSSARSSQATRERSHPEESLPRRAAVIRGTSCIPAAKLDGTLLIVPCSAEKSRGGTTIRGGPSVLDLLPRHLADDLRQARHDIAEQAHLNDARLLPAWRRYGGYLYRAAGSTLDQLAAARRPLLIISGGYGIVLGEEMIGDYDRRFQLRDWPRGLLDACIAQVAHAFGVERALAFCSRTSDYAKLVRRVDWRSCGVEAELVAPISRGGGAMVRVPRASGEAIAAFVANELHDLWRSSDDLSLEIEVLSRASAGTPIDNLLARLGDVDNTEAPADFPLDREAAALPGLYAWWADAAARELLGETLGGSLPALIYAGQAGATTKRSGTERSATLASRVAGNHLRGNIRSSTFRLTLAALLSEHLGLVLQRSSVLDATSERALSEWMSTHLRVVVAPVADRAVLSGLEEAVLERLDPPLNLAGMRPSPARSVLRARRKALTAGSVGQKPQPES